MALINPKLRLAVLVPVFPPCFLLFCFVLATKHYVARSVVLADQNKISQTRGKMF